MYVLILMSTKKETEHLMHLIPKKEQIWNESLLKSVRLL